MIGSHNLLSHSFNQLDGLLGLCARLLVVVVVAVVVVAVRTIAQRLAAVLIVCTWHT